MEATRFATILGGLMARVPGALSAALVDLDGETVDYAGGMDPFDIRVAAAHGRILLNEVDRLGTLGAPRWVIVRGARRTLVVRDLADGYALIVLLRRRAGFTASGRAYSTCERELATEAGWAVPDGSVWHPVSVRVDRRGRPRQVGDALEPVEVLGAVMGLPAREHGFRVRTREGRELTLVREARNCWYADEPLGA